MINRETLRSRWGSIGRKCTPAELSPRSSTSGGSFPQPAGPARARYLLGAPIQPAPLPWDELDVEALDRQVRLAVQSQLDVLRLEAKRGQRRTGSVRAHPWAMRRLAIIGLAVGTVLAGCASTSGARSEPAPDQAAMMAARCPMQVPGTTVAATEVEDGIGLAFTTTTGDVAELRQRVRHMAEMRNQRGGRTMKGQESGGRGGMMKGGEKMMPAATATAEDVEGGARLILQPKDPAQLGALREHVRMKAQRMAAGECPMMSLRSAGEPAPANPGAAGHRGE